MHLFSPAARRDFIDEEGCGSMQGIQRISTGCVCVDRHARAKE